MKSAPNYRIYYASQFRDIERHKMGWIDFHADTVEDAIKFMLKGSLGSQIMKSLVIRYPAIRRDGLFIGAVWNERSLSDKIEENEWEVNDLEASSDDADRKAEPAGGPSPRSGESGTRSAPPKNGIQNETRPGDEALKI